MNDRLKEKASQAIVAADSEQRAIQKDRIGDLLNRQLPAIQAALPGTMDATRYTRIVVTCIRQNPKLALCTPMSLLGAVMVAAQLGLEPGPMGLAYLIPYWNKNADNGEGGRGAYEVQLQLGYKGLLTLARRSGQVGAVFASVVREGDYFKEHRGSEPRIVHEPLDAPEDDRAITHVYAVANLHVAGVNEPDRQFIVMRKEEVDKIRDRKRKANKGAATPWDTDEEEMCKKTAVRRLCKMLPLEADIQRAIATDEIVTHSIVKDLTEVVDESEGPVPAAAELLGNPAEEEPDAPADENLDEEQPWPGEEGKLL